MFTSGSLTHSINIYVVENVVQSLVAWGLVLLAIKLLKVRDPATKIKMLLIPVVVPVFSSPLYYLLFPSRKQMPVIAVDDIINLDRVVALLESNWLSSGIFWGAFGVLLVFFLFKSIISATALLYLPRRYQRLEEGMDRRLDALLNRALMKTGIKRPVVLLNPERDFQCCVFGLGRAYLLMSRALLDEASDEQLEAALLHEMAHLRRRDHWLGFFLLILGQIYFFNPVIRVLSSRILREVELACDHMAVSLGQKPTAYAESLLRMWEWRSSRPSPSNSIMPFAQGGRWLRERVMRLLDDLPPTIPSLHQRLPEATAAFSLVALFFIC